MPATTQALPGSTFNIGPITVREADSDSQPLVINQGETFRLSVDFGGDHAFHSMANSRIGFEVTYSAFDLVEYPGAEQIIGRVSGNLVPHKWQYSDPETTLTLTNGVPPIPLGVGGDSNGALKSGVYRIIAVVTFPTFAGFIGYDEMMLQISSLEDA